MKAVIKILKLECGRWGAAIETADQKYGGGLYTTQAMAVAGASHYAASMGATEIVIQEEKQ